MISLISHCIIANAIVAVCLTALTYCTIIIVKNPNSTTTDTIAVMMYQIIMSWLCITLFISITKFYIEAFNTTSECFTTNDFTTLPNPVEIYKLLYIADLCPNLTLLQIHDYPFWCIPKKLPPKLELLYMNNTPKLRELPFTLPPTLTTLSIKNSPITHLPILPSGLQTFTLVNTNMNQLPDLPYSLIDIYLFRDNWINHPIYINMNKIIDRSDFDEIIESVNEDDPNFDDIANEQNRIYLKRIIDYVNECNDMTRVQTRTRQINDKNILLELYMRRMMHPDRLAALKTDPDIDVNDFMAQYVDSL